MYLLQTQLLVNYCYLCLKNSWAAEQSWWSVVNNCYLERNIPPVHVMNLKKIIIKRKAILDIVHELPNIKQL